MENLSHVTNKDEVFLQSIKATNHDFSAFRKITVTGDITALLYPEKVNILKCVYQEESKTMIKIQVLNSASS